MSLNSSSSQPFSFIRERCSNLREGALASLHNAEDLCSSCCEPIAARTSSMCTGCCSCRPKRLCRKLCGSCRSWCGFGSEGASPGSEDGVTPRSGRSRTLSSWSSSPVGLRGLQERLVTVSVPQVDVQRKIVVLGFRGVGKSALIARFVEDQFVDAYEPTIEYTFRTTLLRNHVRFTCDILDTAAQDEYSTLSRQASVGVHGYILVYSTVSRTSFENVKHIHDKLLRVIGGQTIPMILVATKSDLDEYREVSDEEGKQVAAAWGYPFVACSAKRNWNVEQVFTKLLHEVERDSGLLAEEEEEPTCTIL